MPDRLVDEATCWVAITKRHLPEPGIDECPGHFDRANCIFYGNLLTEMEGVKGWKKENWEPRTRIQLSKAAHEGLEFIRRSGAATMSDRQRVLDLPPEWDLIDTANWIEEVDLNTYQKVLAVGPDVIGN